jgi:hypothetical protein
MALVSKRTIPTERPPLIDEVDANLTTVVIRSVDRATHSILNS